MSLFKKKSHSRIHHNFLENIRKSNNETPRQVCPKLKLEIYFQNKLRRTYSVTKSDMIIRKKYSKYVGPK